MAVRFVILTIFFVSIFSFVMFDPLVGADPLPIHEASVIQADQSPQTKRVVFVGDIMLGRHVENIIAEQSVPHLFKNMRSLLHDADYTVGNFEGIISEVHEQTPWMGFRFSIRNKYLTDLKILGFDALSLANNHSFDFGENALTYTRKICKEIKMHCLGDPREVGEKSTKVVVLDDTRIGFLALQTVTATYTDDELRKASTYLNASSDIQIAYVHWGDEYVLTHSAHQERLAHALIDLGFDAVIGHHPHVVQDVSLYNGKPIFYSLGNFIFDQYFSADVQEGLVVSMEIEHDAVHYTLIPITNVETRTQPDFMKEQDAIDMHTRILGGIDTSTSTHVHGRVFTIRRD